MNWSVHLTFDHHLQIHGTWQLRETGLATLLYIRIYIYIRDTLYKANLRLIREWSKVIYRVYEAFVRFPLHPVMALDTAFHAGLVF